MSHNILKSMALELGLLKCRSPDTRRSDTTRSYLEQDKIVFEPALYTWLYMPFAELEKGLRIHLLCSGSQVLMALSDHKLEVERNCVRQCFALGPLPDRRQVGVFLGGFFNNAFQVVVQGCMGKVRPSSFSFVAAMEDVVELNPCRLLEDSETVRRKKLEQW